jgi:hypothetical protein
MRAGFLAGAGLALFPQLLDSHTDRFQLPGNRTPTADSYVAPAFGHRHGNRPRIDIQPSVQYQFHRPTNSYCQRNPRLRPGIGRFILD